MRRNVSYSETNRSTACSGSRWLGTEFEYVDTIIVQYVGCDSVWGPYALDEIFIQDDLDEEGDNSFDEDGDDEDDNEKDGWGEEEWEDE